MQQSLVVRRVVVVVACVVLGMTAVGVDVSQVAVDYCRGLGFTAEVATLESLPFADRSFSVVVMKHVLEHTRHPEAALREARRVLKQGGALFIAVPHAGYRKAVADPARSAFYRPDSSGGVEHWIYFTPETLARILKASHFDVACTHPALLHRKAGLLRGVLDGVLWAPKFVFGQLRTQLALRKEFWTVATRD